MIRRVHLPEMISAVRQTGHPVSNIEPEDSGPALLCEALLQRRGYSFGGLLEVTSSIRSTLIR